MDSHSHSKAQSTTIDDHVLKHLEQLAVNEGSTLRSVYEESVWHLICPDAVIVEPLTLVDAVQQKIQRRKRQAQREGQASSDEDFDDDTDAGAAAFLVRNGSDRADEGGRQTSHPPLVVDGICDGGGGWGEWLDFGPINLSFSASTRQMHLQPTSTVSLNVSLAPGRTLQQKLQLLGSTNSSVIYRETIQCPHNGSSTGREHSPAATVASAATAHTNGGSSSTQFRKRIDRVFEKVSTSQDALRKAGSGALNSNKKARLALLTTVGSGYERGRIESSGLSALETFLARTLIRGQVEPLNSKAGRQKESKKKGAVSPDDLAMAKALGPAVLADKVAALLLLFHSNLTARQVRLIIDGRDVGRASPTAARLLTFLSLFDLVRLECHSVNCFQFTKNGVSRDGEPANSHGKPIVMDFNLADEILLAGRVWLSRRVISDFHHLATAGGAGTQAQNCLRDMLMELVKRLLQLRLLKESILARVLRQRGQSSDGFPPEGIGEAAKDGAKPSPETVGNGAATIEGEGEASEETDSVSDSEGSGLVNEDTVRQKNDEVFGDGRGPLAPNAGAVEVQILASILQGSPMTCQLRQYQVFGVSWMLAREGLTQHALHMALLKGSNPEQAQIQNPSPSSASEDNLNEESQVWDVYEAPATISAQAKWAEQEGSALVLGQNHVTGEIMITPPSLMNSEVYVKMCSGGILADDMGLGKTIQTLALINVSSMLRAQLPLIELSPSASSRHGGEDSLIRGRTLLVVPLSLLGQWQSEIQRHFRPDSIKSVIFHSGAASATTSQLVSADVVITTYGTVLSHFQAIKIDGASQSQKLLQKALTTQSRGHAASSIENEHDHELFRIVWERIVLDEAHNIKNRLSRTALAVTALKADFRWCLTGTPIQNGLEDVFALYHFLRIEPWGHYFWFQKLLNAGLPNQGQNQTLTPAQQRLAEASSIELLRKVSAAILLRRTMFTTNPETGLPILSLPPRRSISVWLEIEDTQKAAYERQFNQSLKKLSDLDKAGLVSANYVNVLQMLLRLRQICCHPLLLSAGSRALARGNEVPVALVDSDADIKNLASALAKTGQADAKYLRLQIRKIVALLSISGALDIAPARSQNSQPDPSPSSKKTRTQTRTTARNAAVAASTNSADRTTHPSMTDSSVSQSADNPATEASLVCPVCMDGVETPVIVHCGHIFCLECAVRSLSFTSKHQMLPKDKLRGKTSPCSVCRVPFGLTDLRIIEKPLVGNKKTSEWLSILKNIRDGDEDDFPWSIKLRCLFAVIQKVISDGYKIVVFSQWVSFLDIIDVMLKRAGMEACRLDGSQSLRERRNQLDLFSSTTSVSYRNPVVPTFENLLPGARRITTGSDGETTGRAAEGTEDFEWEFEPSEANRLKPKKKELGSQSQAGGQVLLASLKAGGVGLNLCVANVLVLMDSWWNPQVEMQAMQRVYRIGQTLPVTIIQLYIRKSVEERILDLQKIKQHKASSVLREGSQAEEKGGPISGAKDVRSDLHALIRSCFSTAFS